MFHSRICSSLIALSAVVPILAQEPATPAKPAKPVVVKPAPVVPSDVPKSDVPNSDVPDADRKQDPDKAKKATDEAKKAAQQAADEAAKALKAAEDAILAAQGQQDPRPAPGGVHPAPEMGQAAADLATKVSELQASIAAEQAELVGTEISVNGTAIDSKALLREVVYLTGGKLVEAKISDFFIAEQIEEAIAGGRKPEEFAVEDDQILEQLEGMMSEFAKEYPGVPFWDVVQAQYGLTRDTFMEQRRQAILFDRVFFPGRPSEWPMITRESILSNTKGEQGTAFMEQIDKVTEGVDENGDPKQVPEFWLNMLRTFVTKQLRKWSDIQWGSHGLPVDEVVRVNDKSWSTTEAYEFVKPGVFAQDLEKALREVVIREALRQKLTEAGHYLTDEQFKERFDAYRKPYDDTPFNTEMIAVRFKGYPCMEAFRARWRLISSFEDMIKDEMTDEALQAHADKRAAFFADGQASIDLIPFQARDLQSGAWVAGGMAAARQRAEAAFARLEKGEVTFDELRDELGEYFALDETKGRLGFKPLNQIRQHIRESEFTDLLQGLAVSDYLFFEAPVGKAIGPLQGTDCYYIARVNSRTPARRKIDVSVDRDRTLVREDYINTRFLQWANEVLSEADIATQ